MNKERRSSRGCCGCSSQADVTPQAVPDVGSTEELGGQTTGRRFKRRVATPWTLPRATQYKAPEQLTEIIITQPGYLPVNAVVRSSEANDELLATLRGTAKGLPTLRTTVETGAVDIKLEDVDGEHVKEGAVAIEGARGRVVVLIDPTSRRFRIGDLDPGSYKVRGAAAAAGRGYCEIEIRKDDVTRVVLGLDGTAVRGSTRVRLGVKGTTETSLNVRGTDKATGKTVFDGRVKVLRRTIELDVPFGAIHWNFDDGSARSCYDTQIIDDLFDLGDLRVVELLPKIPPDPDPPDPRFKGLGQEFSGVTRLLPRMGIRTLEELAAAEPESLMHRLRQLPPEDSAAIHSRALAHAVTAARENLGLAVLRGENQTTLRLNGGETFTRAYRMEAAGKLEIEVEIPQGQQAELLIHGPGGTERKPVAGSQRVTLVASPENVAAGAVFQVALTNTSNSGITGVIRGRSVLDRQPAVFGVAQPTIEDQIIQILRALAMRNPGLGTHIPPAVMQPENIQMWLDRARTLMEAAGVCSINDLGRFRLSPMQVLRPGAYVAPVVQPPNLAQIPALKRYAFSEVLQNSVLFYKPNDILHETAVIMAGEWDIRGESIGQSVVIGHEVRELVVIVGSIRHDGGSRITWEMPTLPAANAYWPNPAPFGPNGPSPGARGEDGALGNDAPHPSQNGGADAVLSAPIVTMFIRDASNNLPPLDLRGQPGGTGGRGQDGGAGGDGAEGLRADGTFFGGCCREAGSGGNGGRGGDAGRGGKGGRGGAGGRVTILTTAPGISVMAAVPPMIDINAGPGGVGGLPGSPGEGGHGGAAGTADCEVWCDDRPERRGANGEGGASGSIGFFGDPGPAIVEDQLQILPITDEQWLQEFNRPHILGLSVWDAEPGESVSVFGKNFDPSMDHVYFDGVDRGPVSSATSAQFTVPPDSEGGYHPVVIRPTGLTDRRSNRANLRVLPQLDELPAPLRWVENQAVTLNGRAFVGGLQVLAQDRSVSPPASFALPVVGVTRTSIAVQVPGGYLGSLRGVRRIVVRNPDGGQSRAERVIRISDTIVVRCAAFRVIGTTPGVGTTRSAGEIAALFDEGAAFSLAGPWQQARIVFRLTQPVADVVTTDTRANVWPLTNTTVDGAISMTAGVVPGALNFFFVRDVEIATAYAYFGGGPLFIGDEGGPLGQVDWQQLVAHEIGHALCLRHVCSVSEGPGTLFNRACDEDDDSGFLMYPNWDVSDGMALHPSEIEPARIGATHVEQGKTAGLPAASLFNLTNTVPQCGAVDTQN